jgi:hypothetical protein
MGWRSGWGMGAGGIWLRFLHGHSKIEKRNSKYEIRKTKLAMCASGRIKRGKVETRTD